jgi:hypothetical protein
MGPVTTAVLDDTCGNLIQITHQGGGAHLQFKQPRAARPGPRRPALSQDAATAGSSTLVKQIGQRGSSGGIAGLSAGQIRRGW